MKTLLITNSVFNCNEGDANSTAGSDVQLTLLESLNLNNELKVDVLDCSESGSVNFGGDYQNKIKGLKVGGYLRRIMPVTVLNALLYLYKNKPNLIVKYNLYIQQLVAIIIYRLLFNVKVIVVVQDYRKGKSFTVRQRLSDKLCIQLLRFTDYCLPITDYISDEIPLHKGRKKIYSGGVTRACENLILHKKNIMKKQAVFAGYLSEYNGLDVIVNFWLENDIKIKLVIYGDGPLKSFVENSQRKCEYIVYRGKVNQKVVMEEIQRSNFYFCLRYSKGIDSRYFYPSKFFIGLYSSSVLLYNRFECLLSDFDLDYPFVLDESFSGLANLLNSDDESLINNLAEEQQNILKNHKSWVQVLSESIKETYEL
ncbi:MAG: hypothetical protein CML20_11645 [Rheinheimera sp.]|nr:hypothetical protein [Rheinheimera sp.]